MGKLIDADKLIEAIRKLATDAPGTLTTDLQNNIRGGNAGGGKQVEQARAKPNGLADLDTTALEGDAFDVLYRKIKNRFIDEARIDPVLLQLLTRTPELVVEVEPRIVTLDGATMKGRIAKLMADGWFATPRKTGGVRAELARTGADPGGGGTLSDQLSGLKAEGFLTSEGEGWQMATGVKVTKKTIETA